MQHAGRDNAGGGGGGEAQVCAVHTSLARSLPQALMDCHFVRGDTAVPRRFMFLLSSLQQKWRFLKQPDARYDL